MSSNKELKIQSLVLLAKPGQEFKPADFNQYWLDSNKILAGSSIHKSSSFSPLLVQVISETMNFVVTQDQIQIAPSSPELFKDVITTNSLALVKHIDTLHLSGMGLNFNWFIQDNEKSYNILSKEYFYNEKNPASKFFSDGNPMFGNYLSKDIDEGIRLKLDIKPASLLDSKTKSVSKTIQFAFNFHCELKVENQREKVMQILANYDKWYNITEEIMNFFN